MRITCRLATLGFLIGVASTCPKAFAQSSSAEQAIAHGVELREKGRDEEALAEFRRAMALQPSGKARAQMALAEQALGMWVLAEEHLREALRSTDDPFVAKYKSTLLSSLAAIGQHLGTLELRTDARGGEVFIDGAKVGTLPLGEAKRVEAGLRNLEVRSAGFYPVSRTIRVLAGETVRETIELHAQRSSDGEATPSTTNDSGRGAATSPSGGSHDRSSTTPSTSARSESGGDATRTIGWVFVGTSIALLGTGIVGQFVRQGQIASYNEDPTCPGQGAATQPPVCASLVRSADTWNTVSIVGFIGAGVFLSTGIVLVLVGGASSTPQATSSAALACSVDGCRGVF